MELNFVIANWYWPKQFPADNEYNFRLCQLTQAHSTYPLANQFIELIKRAGDFPYMFGTNYKNFIIHECDETCLTG